MLALILVEVTPGSRLFYLQPAERDDGSKSPILC